MLRKNFSTSLGTIVCLAVFAPVAALADETSTAKDKASSNEPLAAILAAQPAKIKERYPARHPLETLNFCEVKKGDTIIETLPGRGWYSGILYPYLGESGKLIGAVYPRKIFDLIGLDKEIVERITSRYAKWPETTAKASVAKGGGIELITMTKMPERYNGTVDNVLFIRSLHNLSRVNKGTGYLETSLAEAFRSLKPGGIVCVVQHRAQEPASDSWADGNNGYLKQSRVIEAFKAAGFKFVEAREINANPKDRPSEGEYVWRLPPTLRGSEENTPNWRKYTEIGESDRMTLKFVKPKQ